MKKHSTSHIHKSVAFLFLPSFQSPSYEKHLICLYTLFAGFNSPLANVGFCYFSAYKLLSLQAGFSSPAQYGIMDELGLSYSQVYFLTLLSYSKPHN